MSAALFIDAADAAVVCDLRRCATSFSAT